MSAGSGGPSAGGNNASSSGGSSPGGLGTQAMASATAPAQAGPASGGGGAGGAGGGSGTPAASAAPGSFEWDAQGGGQRRAQDPGFRTTGGVGISGGLIGASPTPGNGGAAGRSGGQPGFDPTNPFTFGPALKALGQNICNSLPSTDDTINAVDGVAAGMADMLTGGLSTRARAGVYGQIATRNHQDVAFRGGQAVGFGMNIALGRANPCALAPAAGAALKGISAVQGVGSAINSAEAFRNRDIVGGLLNGLGALSSFRMLGRACFAAGTPLLTPDGPTPIEDLQLGDLVLSRPEDGPEGLFVARRVISLFQTYSPLLDLKVGGQVIRTTAEHPFWVVGRGWMAAHQIIVGDPLLGVDGEQTSVEAIDGPKESAPVYNVEVEEYHPYLVGGGFWGFAFWAHNMTCRGASGGSQRNAGPNSGKKTMGLEQAYSDLPVRTSGPTQGLINGKPVVSGTNGGLAQEVFGPKIASLSDEARIAMTHVEGHGAAEMVQNQLSEAVLFINYASGPCKFCRAGVAELLEAGQKLWVVFPRGIGFFTNQGWTRL